MNLADYVVRVREDLRDTDASNYYWTDDEIEGAVERAVEEFNIAWGETIAISDIAEPYTEIIVLGATGYLAMSASIATVDKISTAGRFTTQGFLTWAQTRMERYESQLEALADSRKPRNVISKTLKGEDE
jgi:hypothetical protein